MYLTLPLKKKVALDRSCTGWVGGAGNLIAVLTVNRPCTKYRLRHQLFPGWKNILPYITLYLNSVKTGAMRLEEFSPTRLTVFDLDLHLVAWSVENHPGCG